MAKNTIFLAIGKTVKYALYAGLALFAFAMIMLIGTKGKQDRKSAIIADIVRAEEKSNWEAVKKAQELAANELRKQLPMKVDELTTLLNVVSLGGVLMYGNRISLRTDELNNDEFIGRMKKQLKTNVCHHEGLMNTLNMGGEYMFSYVNLDGLLIGEINITLADCNS